MFIISTYTKIICLQDQLEWSHLGLHGSWYTQLFYMLLITFRSMGSYRVTHRPVTARVDFDKMFMFCCRFCVSMCKCVFIVVKIKCVNSDNISDICDKLNIITNYTHIPQMTHILLKKHTSYNF